jgi:hypothetical protein
MNSAVSATVALDLEAAWYAPRDATSIRTVVLADLTPAGARDAR